jgi:hypothetical protein
MYRDWKKTTQALLDGYPVSNRIDKRGELTMIMLLCLLPFSTLLVFLDNGDGILSTERIFTVIFSVGVVLPFFAFIVALKEWRDFKHVEEEFKKITNNQLGIVESKKNEDPEWEKLAVQYENKLGSYLGKYYQPLITQVMNIGVVPIILGIIALILSDLTSTEPYMTLFSIEINIIMALLLIGGTMEVLAFFFGFMFPDESNNKHHSDEIAIKNNHQAVDEEMMKRILVAVMPEVQKGINETFKQMSIETRVSFNDKSKPNSSASSTNN